MPDLKKVDWKERSFWIAVITVLLTAFTVLSLQSSNIVNPQELVTRDKQIEELKVLVSENAKSIKGNSEQIARLTGYLEAKYDKDHKE